MAITVGIKYCGGCNPLYNRTKYAQDLIKEHEEWDFCDADENEVYDKLYVICGCDRRCAKYTGYNAKEYVIATNTGEYTVHGTCDAQE